MQCREVRITRVTLIAADLGNFIHRAILRKCDEDIVAPRLVQQWSAGFQGGQHIRDGGQLFEIQADRGGDVLRLGARRREAHRHDFTDIPDLVGRQNRLGRVLEPLERRRGDDRLHPGQILRREDDMADIFRNVDCAQSRVSDRAAHESDLARSGETKIGDILSATVQEAIVLFPENRGSDSVLRHQRSPAWPELKQGNM